MSNIDKAKELKENNYMYCEEYDHRMSMRTIGYPIFSNSDRLSQKNTWYQVKDDRQFLEEYDNNDIKLFLQQAEIKNLTREIISEVLMFIFLYYEDQIPCDIWDSEYKVELDKQSQTNIADLKSEKKDNENQYSMLFHVMWEQVYNKNYPKQVYIKPEKVNLTIHNIITKMLSIYSIRDRKMLYQFDFGNNKLENLRVCSTRIATNIYSFYQYKTLFGYQEFALLALYYCGLYVNCARNSVDMEKYLLNAISYSQIALLLFGYIKGNQILLSKTKSAHNFTTGNNDVYEYIQYRVYQYLKKYVFYDRCAHVIDDSEIGDLKLKITRHIMEFEGYFEVCGFCKAHLGSSATIKNFIQYEKRMKDQNKSVSSGKPFETLGKIVEFYLTITLYPHCVTINRNKQESKNLLNLIEKLKKKKIEIEDV